MNIYTLKFALLFIANTVVSTNTWCAQESSSCGDTTQIEMNACAQEKFKHADGELNRLYKEKMAVLETKKSKDRLRDAQRAWVTFRDKACSYESDQFSDGSIWGSMHFDCMERQTQKRIGDLKEYLVCTSNDCPN